MGYIVVNVEIDSSNSFRYIKKNHFVTAEADIDDSIKRKRIRVSLNYCSQLLFVVIESTISNLADSL